MGAKTPLEWKPKLDIREEDNLDILMLAGTVPHGSTVRKRTGEKAYTLRHNLVVYQDQKSDTPPMTINGLFIVDERGNINQIAPDKIVCWSVAAQDLVRMLVDDWEGPPQ